MTATLGQEIVSGRKAATPNVQLSVCSILLMSAAIFLVSLGLGYEVVVVLGTQWSCVDCGFAMAFGGCGCLDFFRRWVRGCKVTITWVGHPLVNF